MSPSLRAVRKEVQSTACDKDGWPLYPGTWVEVWLLHPLMGVWFLVSFSPGPPPEAA